MGFSYTGGRGDSQCAHLVANGGVVGRLGHAGVANLNLALVLLRVCRGAVGVSDEGTKRQQPCRSMVRCSSPLMAASSFSSASAFALSILSTSAWSRFHPSCSQQ